jgi:two-component system response regulator PhcR
VVAQQHLSGPDGNDLLRRTGEEFPHAVRILVSSDGDHSALSKRVASGEIFRVLGKPLDLSVVKEALRTAMELVRKRNERKQRFLAINETLSFLAHELNTPLAAISNFARGVQQRTADGHATEQQQREIEKVAGLMHDNARYCQAVLSEFVDSVLHAGDAADDYKPTARRLIESVLDTYPLTAAQRAAIAVQINCDFAIAALPNCVALVVSSLVARALRAMRAAAQPALSILALVDGHPQIHLVNNGPVISELVLQNLMQDPVTMRADGTNGEWGIIFCKRIMQSFGGGVRIESDAGSFTRVMLDFPVDKCRATGI